MNIAKGELQNLLSSLPAAERAIHSDKGRETVVVFDADEKGLFARREAGTSVDVSDKLDELKGCTLTHNHSGGHSFSSADIGTACAGQLAEIRAVSRAFTYSMRPPPDGWNRETWNAAFFPQFERELNRRRDALRPLLVSGTMTLREANARLTEQLHDVWEAVAAQTGLVYKRDATTGKGADGDG